MVACEKQTNTYMYKIVQLIVSKYCKYQVQLEANSENKRPTFEVKPNGIYIMPYLVWYRYGALKSN